MKLNPVTVAPAEGCLGPEQDQIGPAVAVNVHWLPALCVKDGPGQLRPIVSGLKAQLPRIRRGVEGVTVNREVIVSCAATEVRRDVDEVRSAVAVDVGRDHLLNAWVREAALVGGDVQVLNPD